MTTYLSRSAWTTASAGGSSLTGGQLVGVAVHWPGTKQAVIGAQSQSATAARIKGYRDFHVNEHGWSDLGYNLVIDQAGRVWQGRTTSWAGNRVGAHCASPTNPNANRKYVGVLLILGQSEQPSTAMVAAFRDWYHMRFLPIWPGRTDVRGHGQVSGAQTNCPGTRAKALISTLTQKPGGSTPPTKPPPSQEDDMPSADEVADAVVKRLTRPVTANMWAAKNGIFNAGRQITPTDALRQSWAYGIANLQLNRQQVSEIAAIRAEQAAQRVLLVTLAAEESGVPLTDDQIRTLAERIAQAGQGACNDVLDRLTSAGEALAGGDES